MKSKQNIDIDLKNKLGHYNPAEGEPDWAGFKKSYSRFLTEKKRRKRLALLSSLIILTVLISGTLVLFSLQNDGKDNTIDNFKAESNKDVNKGNPQEKSKLFIQPETKSDITKKTDKIHPDTKINTYNENNQYDLNTGSEREDHQTNAGSMSNSNNLSHSDVFEKLFVQSLTSNFREFKLLLKSKLPTKTRNKKDFINSIRPKLSFSFSTNLNYSGNDIYIDNNVRDQFHEKYESVKNKSEKKGLSYSVGVNINYILTNRVSINSGLYYTSFNQDLNYDYINHDIPVIDSTTGVILGYLYDPNGNYLDLSYTNKSRFIEVPLIFSYTMFSVKRLAISMKFGGSVYYQFKPDAYRLSYDELTLSKIGKQDIRRLNYGISTAIGFEYMLTDRLSLKLEPGYKKLLRSGYSEKKYEYKPFSYGINTKLEFYFQ